MPPSFLPARSAGLGSAASAAESWACCWWLHAARAKPRARASSAFLIVMSIFLVVKKWSATRGSAPANIMTIPLPLSSVVMGFFVKNPLKHSRHIDGDCGCLAAADAQGSHPALAAAGVQGIHEGDHQAIAAGADRVAQGAFTAVDVHPVVEAAQVLHR